MGAALHLLTVADAARLIAARRLSPVELTAALLDRIEQLDSQVSAFITVTPELALRQAKAAEAEIAAGKYRGPLHGIPFALKDLYDTAGVLTSGNSKICLGNIPKQDATAVAKLYEAGAVLVGKLATHEFAHGGPATDLPFPPARNPWNLEHFTGGSSSGSGAALASAFVPFALGTDTGGSIRGPSSLCGVVGIRPTYGLVSRHGVMPSAYTFDACGPMARSVEDCALVLGALAGHDPKDPTSVESPVEDYRAALRPDLRGLRIGVIRHFWEEDVSVHKEAAQAMEAALDVLRRLGARVDTVRVRPLNDYYDVAKTIALPELVSIHRKELVERPGDFSADFRIRGGLGACLFEAGDYVDAQRERRKMLVELKPLYERCDVFVTTAAPGPAPRLDSYRSMSYWQRPNMTTLFSMTGGPALVLCNGFTQGGLPLGMQIGGKPFGEGNVLRVGYAYQQATEWHARHPTLTPGGVVPKISIDSVPSDPPDIDARTTSLVEAMAQRAHLELTPSQFAELCHSAPYVLAMIERVRRYRDASEEPAGVFRAAELL